MSDTKHTPLTGKELRSLDRSASLRERAAAEILRLRESKADLLAACELAIKNTELAIGDPIMILPIRIACQKAIAKATGKTK